MPSHAIHTNLMVIRLQNAKDPDSCGCSVKRIVAAHEGSFCVMQAGIPVVTEAALLKDETGLSCGADSLRNKCIGEAWLLHNPLPDLLAHIVRPAST